MTAAVEARTRAAEAEAAVAQGTGNGARSRGGWLCVQWLSQSSTMVAGAGRRSDGGSGCEQVRRCRLSRIRARLGEGEEN